jgi:glutamyl-tRNA synthetase
LPPSRRLTDLPVEHRVERVRTRFAPSPTGFLHIGGARTALFNWLYARHFGGDFILRIEDTDTHRSKEAYSQAIVEGLAWLGLNPDEGPIYQSGRFERYQAVADALIRQGSAYRCYCTPEELEVRRNEQVHRGEKPRYDGHCRDFSGVRPGVAPVVRFRTPQEGKVGFADHVRGAIGFENAELDDLVILRSDGTPTYNFGVVVDDHDMGITHVIRGDDHINNTPRQIHIYHALGFPLPEFAHLPMILGPDGSRLSKRHGAVSVEQYRLDGFLPEAMVNYLVRLGWSHGDQEIFSMEEMVQYFDLTAISRSPAIFNRDKLTWLNQHYLKTLPVEKLQPALESLLPSVGLTEWVSPVLGSVIPLLQGRSRTLTEMAESCLVFYREPEAYDEKAWREHLGSGQEHLLEVVQKRLAAQLEWTPEALHHILTEIAQTEGLKLGQVAQPIRVALTGNTVSPPIDQTLAVLGKERSLARLDRAHARQAGLAAR